MFVCMHDMATLKPTFFITLSLEEAKHKYNKREQRRNVEGSRPV